VIVRGAYGIPDKTKYTLAAASPPGASEKGEASDNSKDKPGGKDQPADKANDKGKD